MGIKNYRAALKTRIKRLFLMSFALLPSLLFMMVSFVFIDTYYSDIENIRIISGLILLTVLFPLSSWYGGKKLDTLIKQFQKEDEEIK